VDGSLYNGFTVLRKRQRLYIQQFLFAAHAKAIG
jgi:hypothetical protein